jgi:putative endonuclease
MSAAVYITTNYTHTVLYTGVTSNLERRVWDHRSKTNADSFTARYQVDKLVYYEFHELTIDAIAREKMIKKKSRRGKILLIESMNPTWRDLSL